MDGDRFDALTKRLGTGTSRRRVLRGLAGGAAALGAAVGRGPVAAAPNSCAVGCAGLPGPQKAACKQACRQCGGDINRVCIGFGPVGPSAFACCPEGTACSFDTGECVEVATCPSGEPAEACSLGITTNCPENEACALVVDTAGGCACIERFCGEPEVPCESSDDCGGSVCVEVPGCCGSTRFCATACGASGGGSTTGASVRGWR